MNKMGTEPALEKITAWMRDLYGAHLVSLAVFGSLARGTHHGEHSDINLIAVLDRADPATLALGADAIRWWRDQGNPAPIVLSRAEQASSADVFPIEYLDMQSAHRLLHGEELFADAPHFPEQHRLLLEHELRALLLRLRSAFVSLQNDLKAMERALTASVSTALTLLRHALVAVGEPMPATGAAAIAAAALRFGFDAAPLEAIANARHQGRHLGGDRTRALFADYLIALSAVERALETTHVS